MTDGIGPGMTFQELVEVWERIRPRRIIFCSAADADRIRAAVEAADLGGVEVMVSEFVGPGTYITADPRMLELPGHPFKLGPTRG